MQRQGSRSQPLLQESRKTSGSGYSRLKRPLVSFSQWTQLAASFLEGRARQWLIAKCFDIGRCSTSQKLRKKIQEAFAFEHQDEYDRQRQSRGKVATSKILSMGLNADA